MRESIFLGLDLGSVSLSLAALEKETIIHTDYLRAEGKPALKLLEILNSLAKLDIDNISGICATGSGGKLISRILEIPFINEIQAHANGTTHLYPEIRTIIEIGGQDSKLIILEDRQIIRSSMNELCAAGTGSFLDGQAAALGVAIEEFGSIACSSLNPARIAGRCAVFAKSDAVHERQKGRKLEDILMGLCLALAGTYIGGLVKCESLPKPIAFQGGVASNLGMIKAFEQLAGCNKDELIIPTNYKEMGAVGAAIRGKKKYPCSLKLYDLIRKTENFIISESRENPNKKKTAIITADKFKKHPKKIEMPFISKNISENFYVGLDVGSVSTCGVLLSEKGEFAGGTYVKTGTDPLIAVEEAFGELGNLAGNSRIIGAGVTGSGRRLVADFIGASLTINEISAQAKATAFFHPDADTVFEIGGQDSKFIRLKDRQVVDFDMNKVCAAGTGVFLEEQMKRLNLELPEGIKLALSSVNPVDLKSRCTVFIESDLVHHLSGGYPIEDICAGLMLAVARNYIETCTGGKRIGERLFFQGGVASNEAVVLAFEKILDRQVRVTPYNIFTGAIGAALFLKNLPGTISWSGFDLKEKIRYLPSFECTGCVNHCIIDKIVFGKREHFSGGRCGRWDSVGGSSFENPINPEFKLDMIDQSFWKRRESLLWGGQFE